MFISSYIPENDQVIIDNKIFLYNYSDLIMPKIHTKSFQDSDRISQLLFRSEVSVCFSDQFSSFKKGQN